MYDRAKACNIFFLDTTNKSEKGSYLSLSELEFENESVKTDKKMKH